VITIKEHNKVGLEACFSIQAIDDYLLVAFCVFLCSFAFVFLFEAPKELFESIFFSSVL
jgi:hypothetical protein